MAPFPYMKPTLVLGASPAPHRYSFLAAQRLNQHGYKTYLLGKRAGAVAGTDIQTDPDQVEVADLDTITVYLNPGNQREYYDWIISKKPNRVIFNPGSENRELAGKLGENGIDVVNACTLVMLGTGQY
jgi:predicted CoA-binding protein